MINKRRLIGLAQRLIRINSQNPPGDETKIAAFVQDYLQNLGLKTKIYEFKKGRPNVVSILAGRSKKYSLLITPHLDTVPAGGNWRYSPFKGIIQKSRLYGLGATDCKGNLACALEVINSLVEEKVTLDYDLIFAATADEESGSHLGLIPLLGKGILKPKVALVLDSDDFNIIITQKGLIHLKVKLQGKRAHGAYPWRGINAIEIAINILNALKAHKFIYPKNKFLKPPTLNIGTIKGGDKVNIVADWCEFELDFRFLPGMSEKTIFKKIKDIIKKYTQKFSRRSGIPLKAGKIKIKSIQKPYAIEKNHPLVNRLSQAARKFKVNAVIKGSEGATTITFFKKKNIPAIATGFGSTQCAHTADEYVKIDNLYKGALVLEEFLKRYKFR
jgi:succinyl-diaminopimelate desuccinylase